MSIWQEIIVEAVNADQYRIYMAGFHALATMHGGTRPKIKCNYSLAFASEVLITGKPRCNYI
nr:hypothetical protein psn0606-3_00018 [Shigella sonnei]